MNDARAEGLAAVAYTPDGLSAHLLRAGLEGRGIEARVLGDLSAGMISFPTTSTAVSVNVAARDYERAVEEVRSLVEAWSLANAQDVGAECAVCGYNLAGLKAPERCPECGVEFRALARMRSNVTIAGDPNARPRGHGAVTAVGWLVLSLWGGALLFVATALLAMMLY